MAPVRPAYIKLYGIFGWNRHMNQRDNKGVVAEGDLGRFVEEEGEEGA